MEGIFPAPLSFEGMMPENIIKVENLGKAYRIGLKEPRHDTLTAKMMSWAKTPIKNFKNIRSLKKIAPGEEHEDIFWALRNISFEVKEGEVLGIIGKNGAGKTTLLKILSKITEPTTGKAELFGRIGSLLEVGTGFNPELTGRENIYLNGTILGMSKKEVDDKFFNIVDFSGVERFIDTPVKRYSSGMRVRLAFSVAAQLEAEILFIDEVLAVGDEEFQRKCLGKMNEVARKGRTILFVSHNMNAIHSLCDRCLVLKDGIIDFCGKPKEAVDHYLSRQKPLSLNDTIPEKASSINTGEAKFKRIRLIDNKGEMIREVHYKQNLIFRLGLDVFQKIKDALLDILIHNKVGIPLVYSLNSMNAAFPLILNEGSYEIDLEMNNYLQPNDYSVTIGIHYSNGRTIDYVEDIYDFSVLKIASEDELRYKYIWGHGNIWLESKWIVSKKD